MLGLPLALPLTWPVASLLRGSQSPRGRPVQVLDSTLFPPKGDLLRARAQIISMIEFCTSAGTAPEPEDGDYAPCLLPAFPGI